MKIPAYIKSPPGSAATFSRDQKDPGKSNDVAFLCSALKNWHNSISNLSIYKTSKGKSVALFIDNNGDEIHPLTLKNQSTQNLKFKNSLSRKTLIKRVRNTVYYFRTALINRDLREQTLIINGLQLFNEGRPIEAHIQKINRSLKWDLNSDEDISFIFHNNLDKTPKTQRFLQRAGKTINPKNNSKIIFCPIDGYVRYITGKLLSPEWTWEKLVGREFKMAFCPHCLGFFNSELISLS